MSLRSWIKDHSRPLAGNAHLWGRYTAGPASRRLAAGGHLGLGEHERRQGPTLSLPFRYLAASLVFLALFSLLLPFNGDLFLGAFRTPGLLALVHILTPGWITTTILGAAFKLVPVALQVGLYSEHLPNVLLPIYLAGLLTLLVSLWQFQTTWIIVGASLLLLVALGYLVLMVGTLTRVRHWDVVATHVAASVCFAVLIPVLAVRSWRAWACSSISSRSSTASAGGGCSTSTPRSPRLVQPSFA